MQCACTLALQRQRAHAHAALHLALRLHAAPRAWHAARVAPLPGM
jgi:hypothetical protein